MVEHAPIFSDEEKGQIAASARDVARIGEDCIWSLVYAKLELMKISVKAVHNGVIIDGQKYSSSQINHEIDVVSEVINQSRTILQFEGRDELSELDRNSILVGMGSIFDPESEISRKLRGDGVDFFKND